MRSFRTLVFILLGSAAAGAASAQTASVVGKVSDVAGKPIVGAEIAVSCDAFPDRVYKGTTDKRGNYDVEGVFTSEQAPMWKVLVTAKGYVPAHVSIVARDAGKTRYFDDDRNLRPSAPAVEVKLKAYAEARLEFTMGPADDETETALVPGGVEAPGLPAAQAAAPAGGAPPPPDDYGLAIEKVRAGDPEASVDLFKKAIEAKPDDWERRDLFAKVLLRLDRQGEATIQANKAAALAPDKAAPLVTLTDIYMARGLAAKADEALAKAQKLEPDNVKVLERSAEMAAQSGKLDEGIDLYQKVLDKKPGSTEVMVAMADLYNRKKQPKKAEEILDQVVKLDPNNAYRTFYNLGVVIENRDDITEADNRKAIEAFRKAIALKPDYAVAHRDLAFALLHSGTKPEQIEATKELKRYIELDPSARDAGDIKATIQSLSK
jgi:tetratricopeptide (TPR) repeat protein